jgi:hypothetical protein
MIKSARSLLHLDLYHFLKYEMGELWKAISDIFFLNKNVKGSFPSAPKVSNHPRNGS